MRVSMLLLGYLSLFMASASAQDWHGPSAADAGRSAPAGANQYSLAALEKAAFLGQREASALLAVLLQDSPEVENNLVKSAIHFQVAIVAGCSDLEVPAARAVARLSPDERASYETILPFWIPARGTLPDMPNKGPCLSW